MVAENLNELVDKAGLSQTALGKKAGVSQKTVSNFLNPGQRAAGAKGKQPSGKLTELEMICNVFQVPVWQVCREMTAKEREMYRRIERAYQDLVADGP